MSTAVEYGNALYLVAEELGIVDAMEHDARTLAAVLAEQPEYLRLIDSPALSRRERESLIDEAMGGLDERLTNLMKLLAASHSLHIMPQVLRAFETLSDEKHGIARVEAISAVALTAEQTSRLTERLQRRTGFTVLLTNTVDPSVLGGIRLRGMGEQIDGTLRARLEGLENALEQMIV